MEQEQSTYRVWVTGTVNVSQWVYVQADNPEQARQEVLADVVDNFEDYEDNWDHSSIVENIVASTVDAIRIFTPEEIENGYV